MILEVPSSFKRPDGKWEHHIRQSDLSTFQMCPELHRRQMLGLTIGDEGDSAIVGSSCHEAYAVVTRLIMEGKETTEPYSEILANVAFDYFHNAWLEAKDNETLRQVQIATLEEARKFILGCLVEWAINIMPMLIQNPDLIESVEHSFDLLVYSDSERDIYLTGTWDLGFNVAVWDYKHSKSMRYSKQKAWQLSRYHPQATHYAWAYDILSYPTQSSDTRTLETTLDYDDDAELEPFYFININPDSKTNKTEVLGPNEGIKVKTVGDCRFHLEVMKSLAYLIEAELPAWPLGPADWWCSSKWCPAWNDCRGKFIGEDPWNLLEKAEKELDKRR